MAEPAVLLDVTGGLSELTLNRPQARNAIDLGLAQSLDEATARLEKDPSVRCVLLRGAGETFCAGGDLKAFAGQDPLGPHLREVTDHLHTSIERLASLDAPVVCAVQGSAAGAGLGLALACDIVLAGASAKFVMAYTRVGLAPDGSSSWSLPRLIGLRRALELALTNRVLDSGEAAEWGLVNRVVSDSELEDEARRTADALAHGATRALGAAKKLIRSSLDHDLAEQMKLEQAELVRSAGMADAGEGISSFGEKRPPRFQGR